jgi:hypothetical protein
VKNAAANIRVWVPHPDPNFELLNVYQEERFLDQIGILS